MADLVLGVAKSLVEGTLTKAQAAIEEESKLRQSAQRNLVFIAGEFQMMQSFLRVTTQDHVRNNVVSTWVLQVRDLAYDVEDCIEFVVHLDTKSDWWSRMISCMVPSRPLDEAVDTIEQLKARVQDVSQRNVRYKLIGESGPKPVMEMRQPGATGATFGMLAKEIYTAAKQREMEALIKLITNKGPDLQVISVWASGGYLGSASIRKVYDNPEIWGKFTYRAWVKLAHPFNLHKFIRSLLDQFYAHSHGEREGANLGTDVQWRKQALAVKENLAQELMQQLMQKTYLVVLEGVSTMVEWDTIRKYFPDSKNASCIVVSTQHFDVATFCTGLPCFQWFSADQPLCVFFKESPQIRDKNHTTNTATATTNTATVLDKICLIGRMSEINELPGYPAKARLNALQVISVWGIAGAGKSSLVRILYQKILQGNEYEKYIWVDVRHPFNLRDFCQTLLLQFHTQSLEANEAISSGRTGIRDPIIECHDLLKVHRCLVVIDNLQSTEEWDLIEDALVSRPSGTVFTVIVNEERIALYCADSKDLVFNVKGLEVGAAVDLFKKVVMRNPYFPVGDIGKDMELQQLISKCGGLPKVIVAVADSLVQMYNWADKTKNLNDNFITNLETRPEFACLRDLFGWIHSYFRSCPDFLKPCIFYLSIFPKFQIIRRRRLVMRWVAEGYSKDRASDTAEENGEELFAKIIEHTMIQPPEQTIMTNMRMVWCQVSAFFHEYIISRPKEENVTFALEVFALKGCCRQTTGRSGRHLVIEESWERDRIVFESIDFSRLRSLTVFGKWESFFISESMKVLRVLDLENASGVTNKDLQNFLKLLPRLKFLSLRGCNGISYLPCSVGDLRQLQVLDVRYTNIVTIPMSITKLKKLQYIRAGTSALPEDPSVPDTVTFKLSEVHRCLQLVGIEVVPEIGKLTTLHTLGVVNVGASGGKAILKDLKNLTQLRKLGVSGVSKKNSKEFCSAVSGHSHLQSLSVWLNRNNKDCLYGMPSETTPPKKLQSLKLYGLAEKLPLWIKQLENLRKLNLEMDILSQDDITVLGGLKELCMLRLRVALCEDGVLNFCLVRDGVHDLCYKNIKVLEIASRSNLKLIIGSRAMKNLELLKAGCCSTGSQLQFDGLKDLSELKEVQVFGSCDETLKKNLMVQFAEYTIKLVFKLSEVNPFAHASAAGNDQTQVSSGGNNQAQASTSTGGNNQTRASTGGNHQTQAYTRENNQRCSFPFLPTTQSSPAMQPPYQQ